jgi:uncharacterized membrane protein
MRTEATPAAKARQPATDRAGLAVGLGLALVLFAGGWARHVNYWSGTLDMGVFDQGLWLLSRGLTPHVDVVDRSLFADHLSPVLALLAPLYRIHASVAWLVAVQSICLGGTVLPLRALARHEGAPPWMAAFLVACSAPLFSAGWFDFHPSTLATLPLAVALLGARQGRRSMCLWAAAAVLFCRADTAWVLVGIAVVARREVRRPLVVMAVAGTLAGTIIPTLLGGHGLWNNYYGNLGSGPADVILHPWRVAAALLSPESFRTLLLWLLPVGFLPLARPRWVVAIVLSGLPLLVSQYPGTHVAWYHYGVQFMPLAVGGALHVMAHAGERAWFMRRVAVGLPLVALAVLSPFSPAAPDGQRVWRFLRPPEGIDVAGAIAMVGPDDVVSASDHLLPQLTHRRQIWPYPTPFAPVEPKGFGPDPSKRAAARVDVVLLEPGESDDVARRAGFVPVAHAPRGVEVLRRTP